MAEMWRERAHSRIGQNFAAFAFVYGRVLGNRYKRDTDLDWRKALDLPGI